MTREEETQLAYREERAEAAMFFICRDLYKIDVPNHPVKDGYRIGFDEGVEYDKKILIDKACEWLSKALDNFHIGTHRANFVDKLKFIDSFKKAMEE